MYPLVVSFMGRIVRRGTLVVETANGYRCRVGDGTGKTVGLRFGDRAAEQRLVLDPALALGELYMEGRVEVAPGSIYDFLALVADNLGWESAPWLGQLQERVGKLVRPLRWRNTRRRSVHNVAHHYDLDRGLYDLFLDADRQYSCAYFEQPGQSLQEAQLAKKRHIAAKLIVEQGQRVLDIGCGWGGLALYINRYCDAQVCGITLSREQIEIARARAGRTGAAGVTFQLQDYRDVVETYDRIVSVGMFEHVGAANYDTFFAKSAELLASDGVMLLHSIGRMEGPGVTNPWIERYIFPGGYAPALSEVLPAIERAGLMVTDIEILRLHYAETLKVWRERFMARRDEAKKLYDERFCRMWEFYLAGSEVAFRHSGLMVFQIQLAKSQAAVPLTRDYIAEREAILRARETQPLEFQAAAE